MMPPPAYTEARLTARFHVQLEYGPLEISSTPRCVTVQGVIRKVFRGDGDVLPGCTVEFELAVFSKSDIDPIAPGGDLWIDREKIERGEYLEAFLDGNPPYLSLARSQYSIIAHLSDKPQMTVPTPADVEAEWKSFRRS